MPEPYGGSGADRLYSMAMMEETSKARTTGLGFSLHSEIVAPYLLKYGTEAQKANYLPRMARGEIIGAIAMSEPGVGSDLQSVKTSAVKDGEGYYTVNGAKTFITNGWNADLVIVVAKTNPALGAKGTSLILLERGMPGFERGKRLKKLGLKAQDTSELFFDNVKVPEANLLGAEGQGFVYLMQELPWERMQIAIGAVASAQQAIEDTMAYVRERKVFGNAVASFQNTRFKLAEMQSQVQMARVFVDHCMSAAAGWRTGCAHRVDGQAQLHRHGRQGHRRVPAAAWRLRLHVGIPDRPRLCRHARVAHLRRHQRDHERGDRAFDGPRQVGRSWKRSMGACRCSSVAATSPTWTRRPMPAVRPTT